jgi:glutaredoxin-like protein NrdH
MTIKVYTNENCVQCERTKKFLDDNNLEYETLSLMDNPEETRKFLDMGFRSAPIVQTEDKIWSGFKLEELKALVAENE